MLRRVSLGTCLLAFIQLPTNAASDSDFFLHWPASGYRWHYNHSNAPSWLSAAEGLSMAKAAAASWSACSQTLIFTGLSTAQPGLLDGINVVGWKNDGSKHSAWTNWRARKNGEAIEADITLYSNIFERYQLKGIDVRLELKKTIIHEFGHILGLAHSDRPSDVMSIGSRTRAEWQLPSNEDITLCRSKHLGDDQATNGQAAFGSGIR